MRSFIPHILLSLFAITSAHALDKALQLFNTIHSRADTLPAPLSIAPDQNWDGVDGKWSTFTLRVGTPPQFVRTFLSFLIYQTWVVLLDLPLPGHLPSTDWREPWNQEQWYLWV
jgi:hypothetical protein